MKANLRFKSSIIAVAISLAFITSVKAEDYFIASDTMVVIEAEHYHDSSNGIAKIGYWEVKSSAAASNGAYIKAPTDGETSFAGEYITDTAASVSYNIKFKKTGTYYAYFLAKAQSDGSDSFHMGTGDTLSDGGYYMNAYASGYTTYDDYGWIYIANNTQSNSPANAYIEVTDTSDVTVLSLYPREKEAIYIDKIVLSTSSDIDVIESDGADYDESEEYVETSGGTSAIYTTSSADQSFSVYPNPVEGDATISYELSGSSMVNVSVYNSYGQVVKTLVNEQQASGAKQVTWSSDEDALAAGVYFIQINTISGSNVQRVLIK